MSLHSQKVLPAARNFKDYERLMESAYEYIVLLESRIGQLKSMVQLAKSYQKKILLHADLVQGLKSDEHGTQFLCQEIKPAGLISTRAQVLNVAKKRGLLSVQRLFLIDSMALNTNYNMIKDIQPDYIEIMPGIIPEMIREVYEETGVPIFAGGLIRSINDVERALAGGAAAVTTSRQEIWKHYEAVKLGS